ncbi:MAG: putative TRAP-T family transporter DctQ [Beijerinckiaceae bacterium]|nr:MAG: putative TRAP-T family transporter DctQ [Beijerinckiaceae bacterium]
MHPINFISGVDRALRAGSLLCVNVAGILILAIIGISALDIFMSFALNRPIAAATNLSEELLPPAVFLSTGMVVRSKADIVVDLLTDWVGGRVKRALEMLAAALSFLFFIILALGAAKLAASSVAIRETAVAAGEFAVWPMKVAFAIGVCMTCLEAARIVILSLFSVADDIPANKKNEEN